MSPSSFDIEYDLRSEDDVVDVCLLPTSFICTLMFLPAVSITKVNPSDEDRKLIRIWPLFFR